MVSPFEGSFDEQTLSQYIVKAPFIFLQCIDDHEILKQMDTRRKKLHRFSRLLSDAKICAIDATGRRDVTLS